MDSIVKSARRILIKQVREWGEILVGFETRNRFELLDETGETVGYAAEEGMGIGRMLARNVLGKLRACRVHIYDRDRTEIGRGDKVFRWYFHRMEVFDGKRRLGAIQRQFSLLHRKFTVEDPNGSEILTIVSPLFRIWTFKILMAGQEVGQISKKWGGIFREMLTDADTFGIEFAHPVLQPEPKKILLVAVFLIDFVCFENNANRGGLLGG